jgi:hypothetical protein
MTFPLSSGQDAQRSVALATALMAEALSLLDQTSFDVSAALLDHAIAVLPGPQGSSRFDALDVGFYI